MVKVEDSFLGVSQNKSGGSVCSTMSLSEVDVVCGTDSIEFFSDISSN